MLFSFGRQFYRSTLYIKSKKLSFADSGDYNLFSSKVTKILSERSRDVILKEQKKKPLNSQGKNHDLTMRHLTL